MTDVHPYVRLVVCDSAVWSDRSGKGRVVGGEKRHLGEVGRRAVHAKPASGWIVRASLRASAIRVSKEANWTNREGIGVLLHVRTLPYVVKVKIMPGMYVRTSARSISHRYEELGDPRRQPARAPGDRFA